MRRPRRPDHRGGCARPRGAAGLVGATVIRCLQGSRAAFVSRSTPGISRVVLCPIQGRPGGSFPRGPPRRPRYQGAVQGQRFTESWGVRRPVWKVSARGLFLILSACCWSGETKEGRAALRGSGPTSGPRGPEPRCAGGSFTRVPQNSRSASGSGHGRHFPLTETAGRMPTSRTAGLRAVLGHGGGQSAPRVLGDVHRGRTAFRHSLVGKRLGSPGRPHGIWTPGSRKQKTGTDGGLLKT